MRRAVDLASTNLPPSRRKAVLLVLGWDGLAVSLVEAARVASASRETVRRDRDLVVAQLARDPAVVDAAAALQEMLVGMGNCTVSEFASAAYDAQLMLDKDATSAVLTTLRASRQLPAVRATATARGKDLLDVDPDAGNRERALLELADGTPRDLTDDADLTAALVALEVLGKVQLLGVSKTWVCLAPSAGAAPGQRALARLVTMTGPLAWTDLLAAWARAGGRSPYVALPPQVDVLADWVRLAPGVRVHEEPVGTQAGVEALAAASLDRTSQFLHATLAAHPGGMPRGELLLAAEKADLRASGLAATLSRHPALIRTERGRWSLRPPSWGLHPQSPVARGSPTARRRRARPTTFTWSPAGELMLEFSVPSGPSPVIAVPSAIARVLAEQRLRVRTPAGDEHGTLTVRDARAWGFGPALGHLHAEPGQRIRLTCDLVRGIAIVLPL